MAIDAETLQKIEDWLDARCRNDMCAVCGNNNWHIGDIFVLPEWVAGKGPTQHGAPSSR